MRYVSIDIETTGLDPKTHQIVEFAAVLDDFSERKPLIECPRYRAVVMPPPNESLTVSPFCLKLHASLWEEMQHYKPGDIGNDHTNYLTSSFLDLGFRAWLYANGYAPGERITVAGKNFAGFDLQFLKELGGDMPVLFRHRTIDPSILFYRPGDNVLPDLKTCIERSGLKLPGNLHTALHDAMAVVGLVRIGLHEPFTRS